MSQEAPSDCHFALAHGWAFDASAWGPMLERLGSGARVTFCGPRFLDQGPATVEVPPEDAICVGFSYGALWLLMNRPKRMRALISISGFPCLAANGNLEAMRALRHGLHKNAPTQVKAFRRLAGVRDPVAHDDLNVAALLEGLDRMLDSDGRGQLAGLDCPVLALASADDPVIAPEVSRNSWPQSAIRWCETGGHALPLTQPEWCAREIEGFVRAHVA